MTIIASYFQSSALVVQVVLNNLLRTYGSQSVYGSEITIAVAGIMQKINAIFVAVVNGVVQGSQPICIFNYISLSRQLVLLVPLLILLTQWLGLNGIIFATLISDAFAGVSLAILLKMG